MIGGQQLGRAQGNFLGCENALCPDLDGGYPGEEICKAALSSIYKIRVLSCICHLRKDTSLSKPRISHLAWDTTFKTHPHLWSHLTRLSNSMGKARVWCPFYTAPHPLSQGEAEPGLKPNPAEGQAQSFLPGSPTPASRGPTILCSKPPSARIPALGPRPGERPWGERPLCSEEGSHKLWAHGG